MQVDAKEGCSEGKEAAQFLEDGDLDELAQIEVEFQGFPH